MILINVKTAVPVSTKSSAFSVVRVLLVSAETFTSPTMMTAFQTHAWNGGTCTDGINEFTCICPSGFTEPKCETNTDECDPIPCLNGGTCNDELDGFSCNCPVGYSGDRCEINDNPSGGSSCEDEISLLADGFISADSNENGPRTTFRSYNGGDVSG